MPSVLFYGGCWIVVTHVDGLPECLAGPFPTEQTALDWIDAQEPEILAAVLAELGTARRNPSILYLGIVRSARLAKIEWLWFDRGIPFRHRGLPQ